MLLLGSLIVSCCTEEAKLQMYFVSPFLPFPRKISPGICISFTYKQVLLS